LRGCFTSILGCVLRGGLGPKSLRGNRFYKSHRDIAEIASYHFKKASIPLKTYLKSLAILEIDPISLKSLQKYKSPTFLNRSLHFSGNVFKKPRFVCEIFILI
jgi:hypothetical protein